jgi:hypothetical protein
VGFAIAFFSNVPAAMAQSDEFNRFGIGLGVFVSERNTTTRLAGQVGGEGTPIDLEGDLGLEKSSSVFRFDGYFRFNERHRLDFSAFDLSRSASKQIQTEIDFDDVIYPIDTVVSADFDLKIYKLAYTWSFMRRDKGYLGLTAGLYIADIGTRLAAESIGAVSGSGITAPLPVVGLRGQYDITEKWVFRGSAELFALEYGDFDGSLSDLYAGVDYRFRDRMAVGLGLNSVNLNVGVDSSGFNGNLDWRYTGGILSVKFDF